MAAAISVDTATLLGDLLPLDLSLTAKMIAVLEAAGVTATTEISRLIGRSVRRVQEARRELHNKVQKITDKLSEAAASAENVHPKARKTSTQSAENGRVNPENAENVHPKRGKRPPSAENGYPDAENVHREKPRTPDVVYTRASAPERARLEPPSGVLTYEDSKKINISPTPQSSGSVPQVASRTTVRPVTDWNQAFARPEDADGVAFDRGKVALDASLRTDWLERFGGDAKALDLALIAVARQVQPGSRAYSLRVQVESALARIAAERLDRDRRYASAVARNSKTSTPEQDLARRKREMMRRF